MKLRVPYFDETKITKFKIDEVNTKRSIATRLPFGKLLGSGEFGRVYAVSGKFASSLLDHVDTMYFGKFKQVPAGKTVVVKLMQAPEKNVQLWLKNAMRELFIQQHLSKAISKVIQGKTFDVKKYVPQVYFGGYIRSSREFIIAMELQPGKTLLDVQSLANKKHYLEIERAYISMLLNNVVHMDFHSGNVMIDDDGNIHLIDFGGAVLLSDVLTTSKLKKFKKRLYKFISYWPKHTTYVTQARNINHFIFNLNLETALENEIQIWPQSASNSMMNMRAMIQKLDNISNLTSRKLTNSQRKKIIASR
jgi:serine/threonine protein kinase